MVDRVASFSQTSQLINNNLRVESEYAKAQLQISSGTKSDNYIDFGTDSRKLLSLESEYKRLEAQRDNAQTALDRTEIMFASMGAMITEAQGFLADLSAALSGNMSDLEIQNQANNSLELVVSSLNVQFEGRYLFSGSATNVEPVDINATGYGGAVIPSVADTTYYQGNNYTHSVEVSDGFTVDYGVTADSAAFEEILRAFDLIITTPDDQATLQEAYDLIQNAASTLAVNQATLSQDSTTIDTALNENIDKISLIENLLAELKGVDLAEVSVRLAELENQLEASYSVTTDLIRLSLVDYL